MIQVTTLKLSKSTFTTVTSAEWYANKVARQSGVRHQVRKENEFWTVEPKGLVGYDVQINGWRAA